MLKALELSNGQIIQVLGVLNQVRGKGLFPETIAGKVVEANSSFHVK